ncbi:AsmA family protein [Pelagibacterium halotolerans]|uniref:AsmA family protein n=1 Tax=Pelagibacterium halotolerans TaxID=531813 RepID=UPI00385044CC
MRVFISIGLVIAAMSVAVLARPLPHAWTDLAETRIVTFIHAATGETLSVAGKTSVTLLPTPSVTLQQVEIGSDRPNGRWSLSAASLSVSLRVLPLLSGRFEPRTLTLDGANIRLERDTHGQPHAVFARLAQYLQHPLLVQTRDSGIEAIVLRGGSVQVVAPGLNEEMTGINARFAMGAEGTPIELDSVLQWHRQTIEFNASLERPRNLFAPAGSAAALTIATTSIDQATNSWGILNASGDPAQTHKTPATLAPFSATGILRITEGGTATLHDAAIETVGTMASGRVLLDLRGDRPLLSGMLEFNAFDFGPYVAGVLPVHYGDLLDIPLTPSWLSDADIDLTMRAPEVYFGRLSFAQPTMRFHAASGRITLTLLETGLAGGQIRGRLAVLPTAFGSSMRFTGSVEHISAGEIGRALWPEATGLPVGQDRPPEGIIYATTTLEGRGTTLGAAIDTLDGWAVTVVRNGSLSGADIVSTLRQLADGRVLPGSGDPLMPVAGRTQFSSFIASATVHDGIVHLPLAQFQGDDFEVSLSGQARLASGRLEAEGMASLDPPTTPTDEGSGVQLPFGLGGTVREPVFAPGIPRIIGRSAPLFATQANGTIPISMDGPPGTSHHQ